MLEGQTSSASKLNFNEDEKCGIDYDMGLIRKVAERTTNKGSPIIQKAKRILDTMVKMTIDLNTSYFPYLKKYFIFW